jgi:hypothetical protein
MARLMACVTAACSLSVRSTVSMAQGEARHLPEVIPHRPHGHSADPFILSN